MLRYRSCVKNWCATVFHTCTIYTGGTWQCIWLRHCATSQKVTGSVPDGVIGIFHWHNPGRTMTLDLTQPLTEMSKKVKWSCYRPGVAQRVGRGIALLFHDRGTRMGWVFSRTPWPHFTLGKDLVPIWQEAGWAPGPVWTGGNLVPTGIRSPTVQPVVSRNTDWATRPTIAVNRLQINNNPRCIESEYECTADVS